MSQLSTTNPGLTQRLDAALSGLAPGYFALVMATGIVSVAMHSNGLKWLSATLLVIAGVAYLCLVLLFTLRFFRHREAVQQDFADPARAFGFFTFVAATCVLGSRLGIEGYFGLALAMLVVASVAWVLLGYVIPWTAVLGRTMRPVLQTANGTWFIWVVASQSVAVLAATLEVIFDQHRRVLALMAVFSWSVGIFLYAAAGVFVGARMLLYELKPESLTPPYWVAMGATAITVVAGARIVGMAEAPMVDATRGLIAGASVFFWAFGSWLIPPLIVAGYWRHFIHKVPLKYEAAWWSVVFPLGMYGVGSRFLGEADKLPIVKMIGFYESWIALGAWTLVFVAMVVNLYRSVLRSPTSF
ncbi:MAG: tellurite resistance/C4-dicarboxylate transporter family protein [Nocardioidaceae bacterium]